MEYIGLFSTGTPPQLFAAIFDTGSSDVWVQGAQCTNCSTGFNGFDSSQSTTFVPVNRNFFLEYGSGAAAGFVMQESMVIGDTLFQDIQMGVVEIESIHLFSYYFCVFY